MDQRQNPDPIHLSSPTQPLADRPSPQAQPDRPTSNPNQPPQFLLHSSGISGKTCGRCRWRQRWFRLPPVQRLAGGSYGPGHLLSSGLTQAIPQGVELGERFSAGAPTVVAGSAAILAAKARLWLWARDFRTISILDDLVDHQPSAPPSPAEPSGRGLATAEPAATGVRLWSRVI